MQKNTTTLASADGVTAAGVFQAHAYGFMDAMLKGPRKWVAGKPSVKAS